MSYTVDDLFNVIDEVKYKGRKIYLRTLSDLDADARLEFITREAVRAYRMLEDPDSVLYQTYVGTMGHNPKEMIESILSARTEEIWAAAQKEVYPMGESEAPNDTPAAKVVEMEAQKEQFRQELDQARKKIYQDAMAQLEDQLGAMSEAELTQEAISARRELAINTTRYRAWNTYTIYASCFADSGCRVHYFPGPTEVYDLNRDAKDFFLAKYQEVDQFSKNYSESGDFLEVSPSAR